MAQVYKKTTFKAIQSVATRATTAEDNSKVAQTLGNFVNFFKQKHLS